MTTTPIYPVKLSKAAALAQDGIITHVRIEPVTQPAHAGWTVRLKTRFGDWLALTTSHRNKEYADTKCYTSYPAMVAELKAYALWHYTGQAA